MRTAITAALVALLLSGCTYWNTAQKVIGRVLNFHRVMAHSPQALTGYLALSTAMKGMKLNRKLRELAYLRTAQLNNCQY